LAAVPVLLGCALLLASWALYRRLLPRDAALWALLFAAFPSAAFLVWTGIPNGYAATTALCGLILWLASTMVEPARWTRLFAFGLLVGLGWWQSLLTLAASGPAVLWLGVQQRHLARSWRAWVVAACGFTLGALPWVVYNLRQPSPLSAATTRPARRPGSRRVMENLGYFFTYSVPELIASRYETLPDLLGAGVAGSLREGLRGPVLILTWPRWSCSCSVPDCPERLVERCAPVSPPPPGYSAWGCSPQSSRSTCSPASARRVGSPCATCCRPPSWSRWRWVGWSASSDAGSGR
jgi:hypothetical protein